MNKISNEKQSGNFANTLLADAVFRPILFSTPMVQAILKGRKTQTRRIIKPEPLKQLFDVNMGYWSEEPADLKQPYIKSKYKVGDILWVRETFEVVPVETAPVDQVYSDVKNKIRYKADGEDAFLKWKPSIFMPKEACRLFLKVTNIRVERVQDISIDDAILEGITEYAYGYWRNYSSSFSGGRPKTNIDYKNPIESFKTLWESINGKESWSQNPWVWIYEFERIERPLGFC